MRRIAAPVLMAVGLGLAACGGSDGSTEVGDSALHGATADQLEVVSSGDLASADLAAPPTGEVVLSIAGEIDQTNNGDRLDLDLATIERLPLVDLTLFEPFEKRDITFRGVWLEDLVGLAGADGSTATITVHALDDYEVTFDFAQLRGGGALLATMADGERMAVADAGPTRIVFSDGDDVGSNKDLWIWSLDLITVE